MTAHGAPWRDRKVEATARTAQSYVTDPTDRDILSRFMHDEPLTEGEELRLAYAILPDIRRALKEQQS